MTRINKKKSIHWFKRYTPRHDGCHVNISHMYDMNGTFYVHMTNYCYISANYNINIFKLI